MSNFGELLRQARAYKGVTLREAERATRINRQYLAALEQEEFTDLPPLTYARGIVRNYAEYLGLDPLNVQAMFEEVHGQRSGGFQVVPAVKPLDIPSHWAPNFAIIAFMVVISAVIFAWLYSAYFAPPDLIPTPGTGGQSALAGTPESIVRQGGSEEPALSTPTPVPTNAPTATPTTAPTATPTPKPKPSPTPTPSSHTFVVTATERVWVQVTVDGKVVFSDVLAAGDARQFSGSQMRVSSGNAAYVRVAVDGVDQGAVGQQWDAEGVYPSGSSR